MKNLIRKGNIKNEDEELIHQYIVLTTLLQVVENDLSLIPSTKMKMKKAYSLLFEDVLDRVNKELSQVKKEMNRQGIKVFDRMKIDKEFSKWEYQCRGYTGETRRWAYALRNQTHEKLLSFIVNNS